MDSKKDATENLGSSRCYAVTVVYVQDEERYDDESGKVETEKGTYAIELLLPIAPFVGLGIGLDPNGADPYYVTLVSVMRDGKIVVEVDSIAWPMQWPGWKKVSDRTHGISCFY